MERFSALNPTPLTPAIPVGNYSILPTAVDPNSRLANYRVVINHGLLTVTQANQTISFSPMPDRNFGDAPFTVTNAVASSGLPVTYAIVSGPATIAGSIITLTNTGVVVVSASQPGNVNYYPATPVTNSFTVNAGVPNVAILNATATSTTTALLAGNINPHGADSVAWFQYGTTTNYGSFSATNTIPSGAPLSVTNAITGLTVNNIYHVQLVTSNSVGMVTSPDTTISTWLPQLTTLPATAVGSHFATLNALLGTNSGASVWFEYGLATNFGGFSPTNRLTPVASPLLTGGTITNVQPGNLYYFRSVASNALGTVVGQTLSFTTTTNGNLTPIAYWRLGEIDSGAASGIVATNTRDSIGTNDLPVTGSPLYASDIGSNAAIHDSSSLSINFGPGTAYALGPRISTLTNNFGIEAWVKPTTTSGGHWIAYNGNTGNSGWGLLQNGSAYQGAFGGIVFFASGTVSLNTWTHLALVRDNGVATLSPTTTSAPNTPSGNFAVGTDPGSTRAGRFNGLIDEVRVFTFTPGQFSTNDLLLYASSVPYVANVAASNITSTGATLSGVVTANSGTSTAWFEYGPATTYGSFSPTSSVPANASLSITNALANLAPGTLYHFRAVAKNGVGTTASDDLTFTTTAAQASEPLVLSAPTLLGNGSFHLISRTLLARPSPFSAPPTWRCRYRTGRC